MKKILPVILLALIGITSCKPKNANVWTKDYQESQYKEVYNSLEVTVKDTAQRRKFAEFIIENLKKKLPHGLESISSDSLHSLSFALGKEYGLKNAKNLNTVIPWTKANEESFKTGIDGELIKSIPDKAKRDKFCDCLIAGLKQKYPDQLVTPIPDSVMSAIAVGCK